MNCRVCKKDKPEEEFYFKNKATGKKQAECKICTKQMVTSHYKNNKDEHIIRVNKKKNNNRMWFKEFKATLKCEQCGERHPACLEFHHTDPKQKEQHISTAVQSGWGLNHIEDEIKKCIVLCSNCHRKLHFNKDL